MTGFLYIVATPIGNLEDITLRAINILSDVDIILAEDTRVTQKLLKMVNDRWSVINRNTGQALSIDHRPLLVSYHQHSSESKRLEILNLLLGGKNIALVTDAGTPGVSDPGNELIDFLLSNESTIKIIPIPGVSSLTTALSVCGFNVNKFIFLGFWPRKKVGKFVEMIKSCGFAFAFYESPFRIVKTLEHLKREFGESKRIFVGRELTKMFETLYRGTISEVIAAIGSGKVKGEIVVVVE